MDCEDSAKPDENALLLQTGRSKRKRRCSKEETDDTVTKKQDSEEPHFKRRRSSLRSVGESSFVDSLKTNPDIAKSGSMEAVTSTPNARESLPRRRKRSSVTLLESSVASTPTSRLDVSGTSLGSSQLDSSTAHDADEMNSTSEEVKQPERSGRRNKCLSALVLLGLGKRKAKEMKDSEVPEKSATDIREETPAKAKGRKEKNLAAEAKTVDVSFKGRESLPLQHELLASKLEGMNDVLPPSVERCGTVKPEWLKPFDLGWRREIVFRNAPKGPNSTKPACDIYYFSSDDTKLRSLPQIIEYLKTAKSSLSADCFTFTKSAIYKEPEEIVRSAALSRGKLSNRSSLPNSKEGSVKSFNDTNDDVASQASSAGGSRRRGAVKKIAKEIKVKAEDSGETDESKADSFTFPVLSEVASAPKKTVLRDAPASKVKLETMDDKQPLPEDAGCLQSDDVDKRKAVRAAASLALRTYMNHALRTVNNPLLHSSEKASPGTTKSKKPKSEKKSFSPSTREKNRAPGKSLCPVVSLTKLKSMDKFSHDSSSTSPRTKKISDAGDVLASPKLSPLSKSTKLNANIHKKLSCGEDVKVRTKKTASLKKSNSVELPSPVRASTAQESEGSAVKSKDAKQDLQPSPSKTSKSQQESNLSAKTLSKSKSVPSSEGKPLPKSDPKSIDKCAVVCERRPSANANSQKPVEWPVATSRLCGMDCPGRLGIPPSLHCATCMCLFHPECIGFGSLLHATPQMDFTCWSCRQLNKELESSNYGLTKCDLPNLGGSVNTKNVKDKKLSATSATTSQFNATSTVTSLGSNVASQNTTNDKVDPLLKQSGSSLGPATSTPEGSEPSASDGSNQPTAQLLVLPLGIVRYLNLSMPLTLLVEQHKVEVKPEQLTTSSVGINIRLPMGTLPDIFVKGPESPLEFRVLSSASSGKQAVSVNLYKWPCASVADSLPPDGIGQEGAADSQMAEDDAAAGRSQVTDLKESCDVTLGLSATEMNCESNDLIPERSAEADVVQSLMETMVEILDVEKCKEKSSRDCEAKDSEMEPPASAVVETKDVGLEKSESKSISEHRTDADSNLLPVDENRDLLAVGSPAVNKKETENLSDIIDDEASESLSETNKDSFAVDCTAAVKNQTENLSNVVDEAGESLSETTECVGGICY